MTEPLLTSRQVADLLGFSSSTIQDWFEAGKLPGFRVGGRLRFRESEVLGWLETKRPDAEEKLSTTPRASGRGVVSMTSTTPLREENDDA
jgi:excisionase family DNA binding protein